CPRMGATPAVIGPVVGRLVLERRPAVVADADALECREHLAGNGVALGCAVSHGATIRKKRSSRNMVPVGGGSRPIAIRMGGSDGRSGDSSGARDPGAVRAGRGG